jgi:hypothetical protein
MALAGAGSALPLCCCSHRAELQGVGPPADSAHRHETAVCVGGYLFMAAVQVGAPGYGVCAGLVPQIPTGAAW